MAPGGGTTRTSRGGAAMLAQDTNRSSSGSSEAPVAASSIKDNRRRPNIQGADETTGPSAGGRRPRTTTMPRTAGPRERRETERDKRKESIQERQRSEKRLTATLDQTSKHKLKQSGQRLVSRAGGSTEARETGAGDRTLRDTPSLVIRKRRQTTGRKSARTITQLQEQASTPGPDLGSRTSSQFTAPGPFLPSHIE